MKRTFTIGILCGLGLMSAYFWADSRASGDVKRLSIMTNFGTKVVYTTDASTDVPAARLDCARRGGTFNACGSPCSPHAEGCLAVCAFTCEDLSGAKR